MANEQQIEFWNLQGGPRWVELQEDLDRELRPLGLLAMDRLGVRAGERVLDIGCGAGDTTLALAERVGEKGHVVGVDISQPLLARAAERLLPGGARVELLLADAQTHGFAPAAFDAVFSRFGVMFFDDPVAAFTNLRGALRSGGRVGFACWQPQANNPLMQLAANAAAQHVPLPEPTTGPGPFAFADPERPRQILRDAGYQDIEVVPLETKVTVGPPGDLDRSTRFLLQMGPAAAALRDAPPARTAEVAVTLRKVLESFATPEGLRLDAAIWLVTAGAPAP